MQGENNSTILIPSRNKLETMPEIFDVEPVDDVAVLHKPVHVVQKPYDDNGRRTEFQGTGKKDKRYREMDI